MYESFTYTYTNRWCNILQSKVCVVKEKVVVINAVLFYDVVLWKNTVRCNIETYIVYEKERKALKRYTNTKYIFNMLIAVYWLLRLMMYSLFWNAVLKIGTNRRNVQDGMERFSLYFVKNNMLNLRNIVLELGERINLLCIILD